MTTLERPADLEDLESLVEQLRTADRDAARERVLKYLDDGDQDHLTSDEVRRLFVARTSARLELGPSLVRCAKIPPEETTDPPLVYACRAWEAARAGDVATMESQMEEAHAGMTFGMDVGAARVMEWSCQALFDVRRSEPLLQLARRGVRSTEGSSSSKARLLLFLGAALARRSQAREAQSALERALEMADRCAGC